MRSTTRENLLSEYHIRYGGYGGIAYHHVSDTYVLRLANINAPACKQDNLWLTLIANKITLRLKLIANRLKIIATSLQSSSSAQINCK
ncbi:MAG: Tn3 family transposase [Dolichospermum sp. WA123]|nr:Tn3 family transposase [Dolichospermum sp. WA123]